MSKNQGNKSIKKYGQGSCVIFLAILITQVLHKTDHIKKQKKNGNYYYKITTIKFHLCIWQFPLLLFSFVIFGPKRKYSN